MAKFDEDDEGYLDESYDLDETYDDDPFADEPDEDLRDDGGPGGSGEGRGVIIGVLVALVLLVGAVIVLVAVSSSDDDGDDDSELVVEETTTSTGPRSTTTTAATATSTTLGVEGDGATSTTAAGGSTTTAKPGATTTTALKASPGNLPAPGTDARLDALWNRCRDGDLQACDQLFAAAPQGSDYSSFGDTCGRRRTTGGAYCLPKKDRPMAKGSDAALDALYDRCTAGDLGSCDQLYFDSYDGSAYEQHATTCGGRGAVAEPPRCTVRFGTTTTTRTGTA